MLWAMLAVLPNKVVKVKDKAATLRRRVRGLWGVAFMVVPNVETEKRHWKA
jgi:hypothetical protein